MEDVHLGPFGLDRVPVLQPSDPAGRLLARIAGVDTDVGSSQKEVRVVAKATD